MNYKKSIYLLVDPRTMKPFYVGMTDCPRDRLNSHVGNCRIKNAKRTTTQEYIKDMVGEGYRPQMVVVQEIETDNMTEVYAVERSWMLKLMEIGHKLTNTRTEIVNCRPSIVRRVFKDENGKILVI